MTIIITLSLEPSYRHDHHSTQPGDMADKGEKTREWRRKGFNITDKSTSIRIEDSSS